MVEPVNKNFLMKKAIEMKKYEKISDEIKPAYFFYKKKPSD